MLKTNSKEVKLKVRAYIMDCIDLSEYEKYKQSTSGRDAIIDLYNVFYDEFKFNIKQQGEYNAFKKWVSGMPTAFNIDFVTADVVNILKFWLNATDEEVKKYNDIQSWNLFIHLIAREFFILHKKALES